MMYIGQKYEQFLLISSSYSPSEIHLQTSKNQGLLRQTLQAHISLQELILSQLLNIHLAKHDVLQCVCGFDLRSDESTEGFNTL